MPRGALTPPTAFSTLEVWASGVWYAVNKQVVNSNGDLAICHTAHTSAAATEPLIGAQTATVWTAATYGMTANQNAALNTATTLDGTHPPIVTGDTILGGATTLDPLAKASDARFPTADQKASFPAGASAADPLAKASGNCATATALATARSIGGSSFDGSADINVVKIVNTEIPQAATDALVAAECYGTIINNYGQGAENTQTLPAAAAGLSFLVIIGTAGAGAFHVKAAANDKIYLDGTALDDADKVSLATPAVGNAATFFCFQTGEAAYDWYCSTINGTWTDGGA